MKYGFLDESGDVGYTREAGNNLVVVIVVVGHPERLRKAVTKTRKDLSRSFDVLPELKAADSDPRLVRKLLTHAVKIGFDAVAWALFQRYERKEETFWRKEETFWRIIRRNVIEVRL